MGRVGFRAFKKIFFQRKKGRKRKKREEKREEI